MASHSADWQSTKKTLLERNCHMFNNPLMSDISFTCGESDKKFNAHKYVLAISSSVFYAMFYRELAETNSVIHLRDTDEESLEAFLRFLYTEQCSKAPEVAVKVLYLAKKYMIPSLTEKCSEVVQKSVKPENVVTVLEQAILLDVKGLEEKCWAVVDSQTTEVVTSEGFKEISQKTLISFLKRNTLKIAEVELFQAVLMWSNHECLKNGFETTDENRRAVIGDAIYEIRFLSMTMKEFAQYVSSSGLLKDGEVIPIYEKFCGFENPNLMWKQPKRLSSFTTTNIQNFARFQCSNLKKPAPGWSYRSDPDGISFSVNKPATFYGVRLFGDDKGSTYEVTLDVNGAKVSGTFTSQVDKEGIYGFNVMLPSSISINQNQVMTLVAQIKGPNSFYGENGNASIVVKGATVTFSNVTGPSNGTSKSLGQFYQIFLLTKM